MCQPHMLGLAYPVYGQQTGHERQEVEGMELKRYLTHNNFLCKIRKRKKTPKSQKEN